MKQNKTEFIVQILLVFFLVSTVSSLIGQTSDGSSWVRFESEIGDFSIATPSTFNVLVNEKGFDIYDSTNQFNPTSFSLKKIKLITSCRDGASFLVERYSTSNLDKAIGELLRQSNLDVVTEFSFGEFKGTMGVIQKDDMYVLEMLIGSKGVVYRIWGGSRTEKNDALKYYFSSLKLNGRNPFSLGSTLNGKIKESVLAIKELTEMPIEVEMLPKAIKNPDLKKNEADNLIVVPKADLDADLLILRKPKAMYVEAARQKGTKGVVTLKVVFGSDGFVRKVLVVSGLPNGLTEQASRAASLIRFLPKQQDKIAMDVVKTFEYAFTIY